MRLLLVLLIFSVLGFLGVFIYFAFQSENKIGARIFDYFMVMDYPNYCNGHGAIKDGVYAFYSRETGWTDNAFLEHKLNNYCPQIIMFDNIKDTGHVPNDPFNGNAQECNSEVRIFQYRQMNIVHLLQVDSDKWWHCLRLGENKLEVIHDSYS